MAKEIIATAGSLQPQRLSAAHVIEVDSRLRSSKYAYTTKAVRAQALRRVLRWLWEYHGTPKLDTLVKTYYGLRPRNVTATDEERAALLEAALPHLRLWILLCSDLAIRSGTAARLGPESYDPATRKLSFVTKCQERLTLPVTDAIAALIDQCDMRVPESFVRQLHRKFPPRFGGRLRALNVDSFQFNLDAAFRKLRQDLGIERRIVPHDLRRTTALAMYHHTKNIRKVQALLGHRHLQSTVWYLDHDLEPIEVETLEQIKKPILAWRKDKTA